MPFVGLEFNLIPLGLANNPRLLLFSKQSVYSSSILDLSRPHSPFSPAGPLHEREAKRAMGIRMDSREAFSFLELIFENDHLQLAHGPEPVRSFALLKKRLQRLLSSDRSVRLH